MQFIKYLGDKLYILLTLLYNINPLSRERVNTYVMIIPFYILKGYNTQIYRQPRYDLKFEQSQVKINDDK